MTNQTEQIFAAFRDLIPRGWWALYQGSLQAGFDERQSFSLVQTYILGQNPSGSRPNDVSGPSTDKPE